MENWIADEDYETADVITRQWTDQRAYFHQTLAFSLLLSKRLFDGSSF